VQSEIQMSRKKCAVFLPPKSSLFLRLFSSGAPSVEEDSSDDASPCFRPKQVKEIKLKSIVNNTFIKNRIDFTHWRNVCLEGRRKMLG
jgi:hypothetical protein